MNRIQRRVRTAWINRSGSGFRNVEISRVVCAHYSGAQIRRHDGPVGAQRSLKTQRPRFGIFRSVVVIQTRSANRSGVGRQQDTVCCVDGYGLVCRQRDGLIEIERQILREVFADAVCRLVIEQSKAGAHDPAVGTQRQPRKADARSDSVVAGLLQRWIVTCLLGCDVRNRYQRQQLTRVGMYLASVIAGDDEPVYFRIRKSISGFHHLPVYLVSDSNIPRKPRRGPPVILSREVRPKGSSVRCAPSNPGLSARWITQ